MNVITDYGTFLREAKSAVMELAELERQEERLSRKLKQDQKSLESEKKLLEDTINQTTKKRLGEIVSSYDKELNKGRNSLKRPEVRGRRQKVRGFGNELWKRPRICGMIIEGFSFILQHCSNRNRFLNTATRIYTTRSTFQDGRRSF